MGNIKGRKRKGKKRSLFLLFAFFLVGVGVAVWRWTRDTGSAVDPATLTTEVVRRDFASTVPATGAVKPQVGAQVSVKETAQSMTLLVGSVAGISLLVGGVGILAVMLISVRERVQEIGLRRAVGACRRDIRNQFLLESAMLAALGGFTGVLVGVAATVAASAYGAWDAIVSWESAGMRGLSQVQGRRKTMP